ncbi:MAG: xylulokinase [Rhodothermaceae bacterium]|nr:xylulokinase [Rhodothermaceae bacterium]
MPYLLGLDSSTTATKALLIDEKGRVLGVASSHYDYETPHPLWTEQHPELWWEGTVSSIRKLIDELDVDPNQITGIGLTGQMHGLVLLDNNQEVLRPALLWNDQRTGSQCNTIRTRLGKENLIAITGNDALTGFTAPKIVWVQEEEPDIYARARHILLPKDYVRLKLTGELASDKAGAAGTLLFDVAKRDWSPEVLKALDINPSFMPQTFEGTEVTGRLTREASIATGLPSGIPVVGGGGDQAAQAVGVGAVKEGIVALTLGTSGVIFASSNTPAIEPDGRLHAFCHAVPDRWHMMGVMLSAAGSLRWYRDTTAPDVSFADLSQEVESVPPGCEGLLFLPYLTGERTPHPDPYARGAFIGLTVRHQRKHMTRAVLEGVGFGLKDSFTLIEGSGLPKAERVLISGGGAKSPQWRQILADILNAELSTVNTAEGAAFGAALLAGIGAGVWPDIDAAHNEVIKVTGTTKPNPASAERYDIFYRLYRELYPALKPANDAIAKMVLEQ